MKLAAHELRAIDKALAPPQDKFDPPQSGFIETENVSYHLGGVVITSPISADEVKEAWFPIIPRGAANNDGKPPIKAFLRVQSVGMKVKELPERCSQAKVNVRVRNAYQSEIMQLRPSYPDTDVSTCLILEEGARPVGVWGSIGIIGLGVFFLLLGLVCLIA